MTEINSSSEQKNNTQLKVILTYCIVIIMFALDQWTKQMVIKAMPIEVDVARHLQLTNPAPSYPFMDILHFTHVVNFGSAFSTFYGQRYLLIAFAGIISLGIIAYERVTASNRTKVLSVSLGFLLAGAFGNLFDRIRLGYVTDFLDLHWNGKNVFAIFNVADVSINLGIYLLIYYFFFQEGKINKAKEAANLEDDDMPNGISKI